MAATAKALAELQKTEKLLKDEKFSQAYEKAKKALKYGRDKEHYLFVLGRAAYGMRNWEQSVQHFEKLCKAFPENDAAKEGLRFAQARLTESRIGNFDFPKLYELAENGIKDIDVADYVGPIKVADIPGRGKGMVATQDVKKGTILLVSKAVAIVGNWQSLDEVAHVVAEKLKRRPEMVGDVNASTMATLERQGFPLRKIRATYDGRTELKTRLHNPLMMLANNYRRSNRSDKYTAQIKLINECAECLGERLLDQVGDCLYARLAECYDREGDAANVRKYADKAVEVLRTRSGGDASVLKKMKPKVAEIDHLL